VKAALHEVLYAETREHAREAVAGFAAEYGPRYTKAVTTLEKDVDALFTFFDFPAEHWKHLRTSNVIELPFATVRLRQRVTKGAGSRTKGLRPLVRAGIAFVDGVQQEGKASKVKARAA
jgi:putative transposase